MRRIQKRKLDRLRQFVRLTLFLLLTVALHMEGYAIEPVDNVQIVLSVSQRFVTDGEEPYPTTDTAHYTLTALEAGTPLPEGSTDNNAYGQYRFALSGTTTTQIKPIRFTRSGIYNYELTETIASGFTYRWTSQTFHLTIYVKNDTEQMIIITNEDNTKVAEMAWTYVYDPSIEPSKPEPPTTEPTKPEPGPTQPTPTDPTTPEPTKPDPTDPAPTRPEPTRPTSPDREDPPAPTVPSTPAPTLPTVTPPPSVRPGDSDSFSPEELEQYMKYLMGEPIALAKNPVEMGEIYNKGNLARTGDDSSTGLWIAVSIISLSVLLTAVVLKRRSQKDESEEMDDQQ